MIATTLDLILVLVILEGGALAMFHRVTGRGVPPRDLVVNLAAGFFLMLAARIALGPGAPVAPLAACLSAALVAHVLDLARRWR